MMLLQKVLLPVGFVLVGALLVLAAVSALSVHAPDPMPEIETLAASVAALEQRAKDNVAFIEALQEKRCVSITTPVVHVAVYSDMNVGTHKVPKKDAR